jgi:hypothetical protein
MNDFRLKKMNKRGKRERQRDERGEASGDD